MPSSEYYAGFFDGDGGIWVQHKMPSNLHEYFRVSCEVTNLEKSIMDALLADYGGHVYQVKHRTGQRPFYRWVTNRKGAIKFLESIYPYAIIKKNRIKLALEATNIQKNRKMGWMEKGESRYTTEQIKRLNEIIMEMRADNSHRKRLDGGKMGPQPKTAQN